MARIYLDEIGGLNQGVLGGYGLPVSPFSTEDYAPTVVEVQTAPTRTRRKQSKPKAKKKNDGIIRNHDSIWDYKIQDDKLLTRRKTSDGKWYDITSNDEARQRIEQFTGKSINNKAKKQVRDTSINNDTLPQQKGTLKHPMYRTIDTTVGAIDESNDGVSFSMF